MRVPSTLYHIDHVGFESGLVTAGFGSNLMDPKWPIRGDHESWDTSTTYRDLFLGEGTEFFEKGGPKIIIFSFLIYSLNPKTHGKKIILPRPPRFEPGPLPTSNNSPLHTRTIVLRLQDNVMSTVGKVLIQYTTSRCISYHGSGPLLAPT